MRTLSSTSLVVLLSCVGGCGRSELHKVEGVVTQDRKPVVGGVVTFKPVGGDSDLVVSALVMRDGRYSLTTTRGAGAPMPGAPAGEYAVYYAPLAGGNRDNSESIRVPMVAVVTPGDNDIPIQVPVHAPGP